MTAAIGACYLCRVLVPLTALAIAILAFEMLRWNMRPAARRLRRMRRIDRSRSRAQRAVP